VSTLHSIVWAPVAIEDLEEIADYVASHDGSDIATSLVERILDRIDPLSRNPRRCRIVPELRAFGIRDYRDLVVSSYRVFFRIQGRTVGIIGVLDGRRDLDQELIRRALGE
jgi:plasmid stabilization system protein ParE